MRLYELKASVKTNFISYCFSTIIVTCFLIVIGVFAFLRIESIVAKANIQGIIDGKNVYTIIDTLRDPDSFSLFREDANNINKLAEFYNMLNESKKFMLISSFDQPMAIRGFKGGEQFLYSQGMGNIENNISIVKSMQVNKNLFDLYNINYEGTEVLDWDNIDYWETEIPVLMGASYTEIYNLGEKIDVNYYNRAYKLRVVGFIDENTFIYYQGDPEFYLDDFIVIPYPSEAHLVDSSDFNFEGILYFAMINSNIAAPNDLDIVNELQQISLQSGFDDFTIAGLPQLTFRYSQMLSVLTSNQTLLTANIFILFVLITLIQSSFARMIVKNRKDVYQLLWTTGMSNYKKQMIDDTLFPYVVSLLISNIILYKLIQEFSMTIFLFVLICQLLISAISISYGKYYVDVEIGNRRMK